MRFIARYERVEANFGFRVVQSVPGSPEDKDHIFEI